MEIRRIDKEIESEVRVTTQELEVENNTILTGKASLAKVNGLHTRRSTIKPQGIKKSPADEVKTDDQAKVVLSINRRDSKRVSDVQSAAVNVAKFHSQGGRRRVVQGWAGIHVIEKNLTADGSSYSIIRKVAPSDISNSMVNTKLCPIQDKNSTSSSTQLGKKKMRRSARNPGRSKPRADAELLEYRRRTFCERFWLPRWYDTDEHYMLWG